MNWYVCLCVCVCVPHSAQLPLIILLFYLYIVIIQNAFIVRYINLCYGDLYYLYLLRPLSLCTFVVIWYNYIIYARILYIYSARTIPN